MKHYLILCRSATSAQRCARLLEGALIRVSVVKAPRGLSGSGCGYALSLHKKLEEAVSLLRSRGLSFGKLYTQEPDGTWREIFL